MVSEKSLKFVLPSVFTFTGHTLAIGWIVGFLPWSAGLLALVFDCLDGHVARKTRTTSEFGALYDWAVDITVAVLLLQRIGAVWLALAVIPLMAAFQSRRAHFSGRACLTFIAIILQVSR
jgi:phosphatidylglycerophosphate synthase